MWAEEEAVAPSGRRGGSWVQPEERSWLAGEREEVSDAAQERGGNRQDIAGLRSPHGEQRDKRLSGWH